MAVTEWPGAKSGFPIVIVGLWGWTLIPKINGLPQQIMSRSQLLVGHKWRYISHLHIPFLNEKNLAWLEKVICITFKNNFLVSLFSRPPVRLSLHFSFLFLYFYFHVSFSDARTSPGPCSYDRSRSQNAILANSPSFSIQDGRRNGTFPIITRG